MSMQKVSDKMLADTGTMPAWDGSALTGIATGETAKGWVNFNGVTTINDSFNVTSITDNGAGRKTVNWDTNFATSHYAVVAIAGITNSNTRTIATISQGSGSVQLWTTESTSTLINSNNISVIAFGEQ